MSATTEPSHERARALRNVLTNWGAFAVNAVIAFLLAPYIVRTLGDEVYGAWVLIGSLVGYLGLLDVGVRSAVTKYIATHHAARDHDEAGRVASAALVFFGASGLLAVGVSALMAGALLPRFDVPPSLGPVASLVLVLSGVTIAITLVTGVFGGIVVGVQRFDRMNGLSIAVALLRAAATVGALELGSGLVGLTLVQLATAGIQGAATWVMSRGLYPELRVWRRDWGRGHLRTLFTFGVTSTLLNASAMLIDYSTSAVIGAFLSVAAITPFAIAANLCFYARQVISGVSHIVGPMAGALEGRRELDRARGVLIAALRFGTLAVAPVVAVFLVQGGAFIALWMGPEYRAEGGPVLFVLGLSVLTFASFQVLTSAMIGLNRHRGMVAAFLLEAAANVALSIVLVREIGLVGVAWGTTLPRLANCLVFGPLYARRQLGVAVSSYLWQGILRPSLAMVPFAAAGLWLESAWPARSMLVFFVQLLGILPLAAAGVWLIALEPHERRSAGATLARALGLARPAPGGPGAP